MKDQLLGVVILIVLLALTVVQLIDTFHLAEAPASSLPRWEYKIVGVQDVAFEPEMAALGLDRWELVTARRASDGAGTMMYEAIFKREKVSSSSE